MLLKPVSLEVRHAVDAYGAFVGRGRLFGISVAWGSVKHGQSLGLMDVLLIHNMWMIFE